MAVRFHPHAEARMFERNVLSTEVIAAIEGGERFPAKFGRTGFRRNFTFEDQWHGKCYKIKQVEIYAVLEGTDWLVISVIAKYF